MKLVRMCGSYRHDDDDDDDDSDCCYRRHSSTSSVVVVVDAVDVHDHCGDWSMESWTCAGEGDDGDGEDGDRVHVPHLSTPLHLHHHRHAVFSFVFVGILCRFLVLSCEILRFLIEVLRFPVFYGDFVGQFSEPLQFPRDGFSSAFVSGRDTSDRNQKNKKNIRNSCTCSQGLYEQRFLQTHPEWLKREKRRDEPIVNCIPTSL